MPRLMLFLLALAASLRAAPLAFRWSSEISEALPFAANAMQGETFGLVAEALQYGAPLTGEASATFYWQTPDMEASSWYAQPAQWDADAATASVTWTPKMDVGSSAYRFFFCVSSEAGKNYRLYGTIRLKQSPGIAPAALVPVDIRDELADQIAADVIGEIDGRYLKLTGGDVTGPITSRLSSASVPGLTVTLGNDDRYYAKHTQAGIQARREVNAPEEFYAFFDVSGGNKIARLKDLGSFLTAEADPTVPEWAKASSKPSYAWSEISGKPTTWAWSAITGKPATYAPSAHTHAISGVEGLQTAIDAKAPLSAVSMTEGGTEYVWVWDPNVGTFALTAGGAAPVYPSED